MTKESNSYILSNFSEISKNKKNKFIIFFERLKNNLIYAKATKVLLE
jgi:hypothetical protein